MGRTKDQDKMCSLQVCHKPYASYYKAGKRWCGKTCYKKATKPVRKEDQEENI